MKDMPQPWPNGMAGEGVLFVEPEMGRVVTQRLGSGRVLAVDSRGSADAEGGGFDDVSVEYVDIFIQYLCI